MSRGIVQEMSRDVKRHCARQRGEEPWCWLFSGALAMRSGDCSGDGAGDFWRWRWRYVSVHSGDFFFHSGDLRSGDYKKKTQGRWGVFEASSVGSHPNKRNACPRRSDAQSGFRVCSVGPKKSAHVVYPEIGSETWIGRPRFRRKSSNRELSSISIVQTPIVVDPCQKPARNPNFSSVHPTSPWRKVVKSSNGLQFYRTQTPCRHTMQKSRSKSGVR